MDLNESNPQASQLRRIQEAQERRPWRYYAPVPVLRDGFHKSTAKIRLLTGPNGGGKTWAGAYELLSYATGYNHIRDEHYPTPNVCWAVALDHQNLGPIMRRTVISMAPKGSHFVAKEMKLILPKPWGSEIYFKACESGVEKFMAERCLAIWFDEEWPGEEGLRIFKESLRRTKPGWPLRLYMTLTPVFGYTWTYDYLWREDSPRRFRGVERFNFNLYDCAQAKGGFLTQEEIEDREQNLDPYERQARLMGEYTLVGGTPAFDPSHLMRALDRCVAGKRYRIKTAGLRDGLAAPLLEEDPDGPLHILVRPVRGRQYILGGDPAMGIRQDSSVASVWDRELPVEVAYFSGNDVDPAQFARDVVAPLATFYNNALAAIEANSQAGGAVLANLQGVYGHLYMRQDFEARKREFSSRYGFWTSDHNRGLLFSTLKASLPMEQFTPSEGLIRQMMNMIVTEKDRIDHMRGRHDDHVLAAAIALTVNRLNPTPRYEPWGFYRETYKGENAWMGN
jgi:hypothetical protein